MNFSRFLALELAVALVLCAGCSKSADQEFKAAETPRQAATQLDQAFASAKGEVKHQAAVASEAMRQGDYEKAVVSLQVVRAAPNATLDQGLAIHQSTVLLESRILQAMESGDPKAKQAYEILKTMKRK